MNTHQHPYEQAALAIGGLRDGRTIALTIRSLTSAEGPIRYPVCTGLPQELVADSYAGALAARAWESLWHSSDTEIHHFVEHAAGYRLLPVGPLGNDDMQLAQRLAASVDRHEDWILALVDRVIASLDAPEKEPDQDWSHDEELGPLEHSDGLDQGGDAYLEPRCPPRSGSQKRDPTRTQQMEIAKILAVLANAYASASSSARVRFWTCAVDGLAIQAPRVLEEVRRRLPETTRDSFPFAPDAAGPRSQAEWIDLKAAARLAGKTHQGFRNICQRTPTLTMLANPNCYEVRA
jgi:hypothetical protein